MFQRGKPGRTQLLAVLVAALAMSLSSAGCQTPEPAVPTVYGPRGSSHTSSEQGSASNGKPEGGDHPGADQPIMATGADANGQPGEKNIVQVGGAMPVPGGCGPDGLQGGPGPIPTEKNMVSLPTYTVAPPDILFIDASRLVPKPPYRLLPLEVLLIQVTDTLPNQPINGPFIVSPEGTVNLGYSYGTVRVQGLTVDQIQSGVRQHLSNILRNPQVSVALTAFRGMQQTRGEHLVRPDGTINLGIYGSVYVAGMTLAQIKGVIEKHLAEFVVEPQVGVDVFSYNSKYYYVIYDGGGYGEQIFKLPCTGNETVLDGIATLQGLPPVASLRRIWIARPAPCGHPCDQILMVDWRAITQGGSTCTNYQLFPGDRVYVAADCLIQADNWLAKILQPIERLLGLSLLASETRQSFHGNGTTGVIVP